MLVYELIDNNKEDWVVFIHGFGGSSNTWKKQIDVFSKEYNLLLIDLPGHGKNSNCIIRKIDTKSLNRDIVETMDYLNIKKAHFVGLSLGTIVIANFAISNPSYVKGIIFGGAVLHIQGIYRFVLRLADFIKRFIPYEVMYKLFAWFMMPKKNHKKSRLIFLREIVKLDKETTFAWIHYLKESLSEKNILEKLDNVGKKILFVSGSEDHCFLCGSKILADKIKFAKMKIIEHCGHVCTIEKFNIFNNVSLNYLATI